MYTYTYEILHIYQHVSIYEDIYLSTIYLEFIDNFSIQIENTGFYLTTVSSVSSFLPTEILSSQ